MDQTSMSHRDQKNSIDVVFSRYYRIIELNNYMEEERAELFGTDLMYELRVARQEAGLMNKESDAPSEFPCVWRTEQ